MRAERSFKGAVGVSGEDGWSNGGEMQVTGSLFRFHNTPGSLATWQAGEPSS
jgi:hypothetical protein